MRSLPPCAVGHTALLGKMVKQEETTQGCEDQEVAIMGALLETAYHRHD